MARKPKNPADYIMPLNMNGLEGRMLRVPAPKNHNREILMIYGHHALIERWWGLIENLNDYGAVTVPDLPGFGGMDTFCKIGQKPTIDNFADYLASFIKMYYKRRRVVIVGISFGFVVATRMLQRYPELSKKVDLVVSLVGFTHHNEFVFKPLSRKMFRYVARLFGTRPLAFIIRYCFLNGPFIKSLYVHLPAAKRRFIEVDPEEFALMTEFEVQLWQANDVSTHWLTTSEFLELDNCQVKIDLPAWHVASKHDHYFDNHIVKQHMMVIFREYQQILIKTKAHTPSVLGDRKILRVLLPPALRRELSKSAD